MNYDFQEARSCMVKKQLWERGIRDERVLQSMSSVPRHLFVPLSLKTQAYDDTPLPIGYGQTISQPYMVALMAEAAQLKSSDIVLDIGTGSGYAAAVLSNLAKKVYSIELVSELAEEAKTRLKECGYSNVNVIQGDGSIGFKAYAPFDAILVAAGAPIVPHSLKEQLAINGRLIIPVGKELFQKLLRITRVDQNHYEEETLDSVRFVPLKGQEGWSN